MKDTERTGTGRPANRDDQGHSPGDKDPSQIGLPKVDASAKVNLPLFGEQRVLPLLSGLAPGAALWVPAIFLYAFTGNGEITKVMGAAGAFLSMLGVAIAMQTDPLTSNPLDRVFGEIGYRVRMFRGDRNQDELAGDGSPGAEPIHGYRRFLRDGTGERVEDRYVQPVYIEGRTTERHTDRELNDLVGEAATAIRRNVKDGADYTTYTTTFQTSVENITKKFEAQMDSGRFLGYQWRYARELIHDIVRYEEREAEAWDAREARTYQDISVHVDELEGRGGYSATGLIDFLKDQLFGVDETGSGYYSLTHHQRRQLRRLMDKRVKAAISIANSISGVEGHRVGPGEHALLVSKYWSGVEGGRRYSDMRAVSDSVDMSVFPPGPSGAETADEPTAEDVAAGRDHRPAGANRYVESHEHVDARDAVEGTEHLAPSVTDKLEAATAAAEANAKEGDELEATGTLQRQGGPPGAIHDDPDDAHDASVFAQLREALLKPITGGDDDRVADRGPSPIERSLAPGSGIHEGENYMRIGDQYVRSFWLTDLPKAPPSAYPKPLINSRGMDFDLKLFGDPIHKDDAKARLERDMNQIGAEVGDADDRGDHDVEHLVEDKHFYQAMYGLLVSHPSVRAWDANGYLTIRVGHTDALDKLATDVEEGIARPTDEELEDAKLRALDDAEEKVRNILEGENIGMTVQESYDRHLEILKSCAPGAPDVYRNQSWNPKGTMVLTGGLAAPFPMNRSTIQEPQGTEYGRSIEHGRKIMASQHDRGAAPHKLTLADSGSGKTYNVSHQALRWFLAGRRPQRRHDAERKLSDAAVEWLYADDFDDRTVIFVDTMGGFEGVTKAMNGNHIEVDGDTKMNPLEIHSSGDDVERSDAIDSFEMGFKAAKNWILDIIEAEGGDADYFKPVVKDMLNETYRRAGVHKNKPETHTVELSPNMGDFLDTMRYFYDHADQETLLGLSDEADQIQKEITDLARRLSAFKKGGQFDNLRGDGEVRLEPGKINYVDLSNIEGDGTADQSDTLPLILRYIYEIVKKAKGETMAVLDEAHYLLDSKRIRQWLQQSSRHWRHHLAGLWFLSHRPGDFRTKESDGDEARDAVRAQCNTIEFFRLKDLEWEIARDTFDMNPNIYRFVQKEAMTGESGEGYSTGAVNFKDKPGWNTFELKVGKFEHALLSWKEKLHGDLYDYLDQFMPNTGPSPEEIAEKRRQLFEQAKRDAREELEAELELEESRRHVEQPDGPAPATAETDGGQAAEQSTNTNTPPRDENGRFVATTEN